MSRKPRNQKREPVNDTERTSLNLAINSYITALDEIHFAAICEKRGHYEQGFPYSIDEIRERINELKSIVKNGWAI